MIFIDFSIKLLSTSTTKLEHFSPNYQATLSRIMLLYSKETGVFMELANSKLLSIN